MKTVPRVYHARREAVAELRFVSPKHIMSTFSRLKWPSILCVLGAVLTVWLVVVLFTSFTGPGISLLVPGQTTFEIKKLGQYTLWSQVEASFQGKLMTFATGLPPGATITIKRQADGATVPVQSKWPTIHRDRGAYFQVIIGKVTFDTAGSYQIDTEGLQEKRALYLDRLDLGTLVTRVFIGSFGPLLFFAGLAWGIVLFLSRHTNWPNQSLEPTAGRRDAHI